MNKDVLASKQSVVNEIVDKAKDNQSILICEYRGLSVAELQEIRRALAKEDAELNVYKNTLVKRALAELQINDADAVLDGPNAIVFSKEISNGPKIIAKYAKRYKDILVIKGGVVENKFVDAEGMKEVAKMPGREGLLSMFLSCLQAPIRSFACAVKAVAEK